MSKPKGAMSSPYCDQKFVNEMIGVVDQATDMMNPKPPPQKPAQPIFNNTPQPAPVPATAPVAKGESEAAAKLRSEMTASYACNKDYDIVSIVGNTLKVVQKSSGVTVEITIQG
jgi:hypothetical protein